MSTVYLVKGPSNYEFDKLYRIFKKYVSPILDEINKSNVENIVIKINLCDARTPETGAITHPMFLDAFLSFLRNRFGWDININVVESDGVVAIPDLFIKWFGFDKIIQKWKAKYVNLSKEPFSQVDAGGKVFKTMPVPDIIRNADLLISMSKLKTNILTKITCSLKNMFGCLPILNKSDYHPVIHETIAEINRIMKPNLNIIDGIIGIGGSQGPSFGIPIRSNIIIMSSDPVAADAVAAKVMGYNPKRVKHILLSHRQGVGNIKFTLRGDFKKIPVFKEYKISFLEYKLLNFAINLQSKSRLMHRKKKR